MIREETKKDESLILLWKAVETENWDKTLRDYEPFKNEIHTHKEMILRDSRIILPVSLRALALDIAHQGHPGVVTMKNTIRAKLWWPGLDKDINEKVKTCKPCTMLAKDYPMEPMQRTILPMRPWDYIGIDFYSSGMFSGHVLVVTDYYSRMLFCQHMPTTTAEALIKVFRKMFKVHGLVGAIKADNGQPFRSREWINFCVRLGIKLYFSIPRNPRQNGQTERSMPGLTRALISAKEDGKTWTETLKSYADIYNSRPHRTTGRNPEDVFFGRQLRRALPRWEMEMVNDEEMRDKDKVAKFRGKQYQDTRERARENEEVHLGDTVLIHNEQKGKMIPRFGGTEYVVKSKEGSKVELVSSQGVGTTRNVSHVRRLFKPTGGGKI